MPSHLIPDGNSPTSQYTAGDNLLVSSNRFTINAAGYEVRAIRWYRYSTGSAAPENLYLWAVSGGTVLAKITSGITDSGAVGWQRTAIIPVPLTSGGAYAAGVRSKANFQLAGITPAATPDNPLAYSATYYGAPQSGDGLPGTADSTQVLIDVEIAGEPGEGGGLTVGDVQNALASWLSEDDVTHTDSLPLLNKAQIDLIKQAVDLIPKAADTDWGNVFDIWRFAGDLAEVQLAAWRLFMDRAGQQLTGGSGGGGSAFFAGDGRQVSETTARIEDRLTDLEAKLTAPPPGGPEWTLVGNDTWDTTGSIALQAHAYLIHIDTWPPGQAAVALPFGTWLPRAGWVATHRDGWMRQREFLDLDRRVIEDGGRLMDGCAWRCKPGFSGTWEAWRLA